MKIPGPDHPITITPATTRWRALFENHVIADSGHALVLKEAAYKPVIYFPRDDVSMAFMSKTERVTHCPYKGDASYYTVLMDGRFAENSVWSYEEPFPAMEQIRGHLAFYPDKVEVYEADETRVTPKAQRTDIDEAILHTDAGDGTSQRPHWPPNVSEPPPPVGE